MRKAIAVLLFSPMLWGQPRVLTLKQAVDLALKQNPDLVISRLDEQKASLEVLAVKEPMLPRLSVGSGLAYTYGMPMSVDGSPPAIFLAKATRSLYNAPQGYAVAQAREATRSAGESTAALNEEIALRTATLFLDLERTVKAEEIAARQVENLQRIEASVRLRVEGGRELPLEAKRAAVNLAHARRRVQSLASARSAYSQSLSMVLGLGPSVEITPAAEERPLEAIPENEPAAVDDALASSHDIRRLESDLAAKYLEVLSFRAARRPRVDLVAQYGLFAKFNNYSQYFNTFNRNNGQIGLAVQVPVFPNSNDEARAAKSAVEARRLQVQINEARSRVESSTRRAWQRLQDAEAGREIARLDLDLSREQVSVLLAQKEEGRATVKQLEEARFQEQERWLGLYEATYQVELARLELLKQTNSLSAALR